MVISTLDMKFRGDLGAALSLLGTVLADTRKRPGCLGVQVVVDEKDPAHVVAIESWESMQHDDDYRAWRATPDGASALGDILAEAPTLTRYTVAEGI